MIRFIGICDRPNEEAPWLYFLGPFYFMVFRNAISGYYVLSYEI